MGARGPKPLPANVHVLRGNASKKPAAALLGEFQPEVEIPSAPQWIWPEAKKEWRRIARELERYGLISRLDRAALVLYCQAWAKMVWAERRLSEAMARAEQARAEADAAGVEYHGGDGIMVPTGTGNFTYSHLWVVGRRAAEDVRRYLDMFGLSPSARTKVTRSDNRQGDLFGSDAGQDAWSAL